MHRTLKSRAARAGLSLSDYLLQELVQLAQRPTIEDLIARIRELPPIRARIDSAAAVRAERAGRR